MTNRSFTTAVFPLIALFSLVATSGESSVVVQYNMEGGTPDNRSSGTQQIEDPDVTNNFFISSATNLTEEGTSNNFSLFSVAGDLGYGPAATVLANSVDQQAWYIVQGDANGLSQGGGSTDTAHDYLEFTLSGADLDLASDAWELTISMGMYHNSAGSAQAGFNLQVDVGSGFVTVADMQANLVSSTDTTPDFADITWDLSSLGDNATSATFRLFGTEAVTSDSGNKALFIDTISVTAVVPENSTIALLFAGLVGLGAVVVVRRRRK